jgi:hypothetical protein
MSIKPIRLQMGCPARERIGQTKASSQRALQSVRRGRALAAPHVAKIACKQGLSDMLTPCLQTQQTQRAMIWKIGHPDHTNL